MSVPESAPTGMQLLPIKDLDNLYAQLTGPHTAMLNPVVSICCKVFYEQRDSCPNCTKASRTNVPPKKYMYLMPDGNVYHTAHYIAYVVVSSIDTLIAATSDVILTAFFVSHLPSPTFARFKANLNALQNQIEPQNLSKITATLLKAGDQQVLNTISVQLQSIHDATVAQLVAQLSAAQTALTTAQQQNGENRHAITQYQAREDAIITGIHLLGVGNIPVTLTHTANITALFKGIDERQRGAIADLDRQIADLNGQIAGLRLSITDFQAKQAAVVAGLGQLGHVVAQLPSPAEITALFTRIQEQWQATTRTHDQTVLALQTRERTLEAKERAFTRGVEQLCLHTGTPVPVLDDPATDIPAAFNAIQAAIQAATDAEAVRYNALSDRHNAFIATKQREFQSILDALVNPRQPAQ